MSDLQLSLKKFNFLNLKTKYLQAIIYKLRSFFAKLTLFYRILQIWPFGWIFKNLSLSSRNAQLVANFTL